MEEFKRRVKEYMKHTKCTYRQAKILIAHYMKLEEDMIKARICPVCGKPTLFIESDGADYNPSYWVECDNYEDGCEFTDDIDEKYSPLHHWYDFDIILWMATDRKEYGNKRMKKELGMCWYKFIEKEIANLSNVS